MSANPVISKVGTFFLILVFILIGLLLAGLVIVDGPVPAHDQTPLNAGIAFFLFLAVGAFIGVIRLWLRSSRRGK